MNLNFTNLILLIFQHVHDVINLHDTILAYAKHFKKMNAQRINIEDQVKAAMMTL